MLFFPKISLNQTFEIVEIGDEVTAVSVGGDTTNYSGVVVLKNEATRFMFEKVQAGTTLPELIKACMEKYTDSTVDEIGPQVMKFLDMLKEQHLLAVDPSKGVKVDDPAAK